MRDLTKYEYLKNVDFESLEVIANGKSKTICFISHICGV